MHTNTPSDDHPSLWKQLLGAGIGMTLALALYNAYAFVSPYAESLLASTVGSTSSSSASLAPRSSQSEVGSTSSASVTSVTSVASSSSTQSSVITVISRESTEQTNKNRYDRIAERVRQISQLDALRRRIPPPLVSATDAATAVQSSAGEADAESENASSAEPVIADTVNESAIVTPTDPFDDTSPVEEGASSSAVVHAGAPKLPSSGLGVWLSVTVALSGALFALPRARKFVYSLI